MKTKFFVAALIVAMMASCWKQPSETKPTQIIPSQSSNTKLNQVEIVVIDGCEYIQYRAYSSYEITPNIKPLMTKMDSLTKEINSLKQELDKLKKKK